MLFAYDGSDCAKVALNDLGRAGLPFELEVKVLCVAEVWLSPDGGTERRGPTIQSETVRKAGRRALEHTQAAGRQASDAVERLRSLFPQWRLAAASLVGSPVRTLVDAAGEWGADLIVAGSHGRSIVGGTVSRQRGSWSGRVRALLRAYCASPAPPSFLPSAHPHCRGWVAGFRRCGSGSSHPELAAGHAIADCDRD